MEDENRKGILTKLALIIFGSLVFLNLLFLDLWFIKNVDKEENPILQAAASSTPTMAEVLPTANQYCPGECRSLIKEATASIQLKETTTTTQTTTTASFATKEFFIPIGSGLNKTDDWEDISGVQVYVDSTKYGRIKKVVFEVSVRVPTKNQWVNVRLFNATDKHPVWFSEVFFPGGSDAKLLVSDPITLDQGEKLYKVQMKTQLKHEAFLDQSRIHITTY